MRSYPQHEGADSDANVSVVLPCHQEAENLKKLLPELTRVIKNAEIMVVDDGSTDDTAAVCHQHGVRRLFHPYRMGNGASIKTGAKAASGSTLVFMDGDGQHDPRDIPRLLGRLDEGFDMIVGARDRRSQASVGRSLANRIYNGLASYMVGHRIDDLTSGFRVVHTHHFRRFIDLLPNGFSYPTTITMAFFRTGLPVGYLPIKTAQRGGNSHISQVKDGIRFLLIIFKIGVLYSPLKLFLPISFAFFSLGIVHYIQSFIFQGRFTNMSALLLSTSVLIFLIGLVSEQITQLMYRSMSSNDET